MATLFTESILVKGQKEGGFESIPPKLFALYVDLIDKKAIKRLCLGQIKKEESIMDETVFFNQGNALNTDVDIKALYVAAQIEKDRSGLHKELVIVRESKSEQYILFEKKVFDKLENKEAYQIIDYLS